MGRVERLQTNLDALRVQESVSIQNSFMMENYIKSEDSATSRYDRRMAEIEYTLKTKLNELDSRKHELVTAILEMS